jgi:hypothetical protein
MASVISCFPLAYGRVHIFFLVLRSIDMAGSASAILSGTERLNSASRAADKATLIFLAAHTIGIVDRGIIEPQANKAL